MIVLHAFMCVYHMHTWCLQSQKKEPLELELRMIVNKHVGAET